VSGAEKMQTASLQAIKTVRGRLNAKTRAVLDKLVRREELTDDEVDDVEQECTEVWVDSGRRQTTTKRLAAHEAIEKHINGRFECAVRAAEFAKP
jgi:hypothetical protein